MFLMQIRTMWDHYFTGIPTRTNEFTSRQTPSDTNVYILNCLFKSITSSSQGGALYCTSATYFLVQTTSFFSCKTSSNQGAICFSNSGGQSVLHEVCGYDCCTTNSNNCQFDHIWWSFSPILKWNSIKNYSISLQIISRKYIIKNRFSLIYFKIN